MAINYKFTCLCNSQDFLEIRVAEEIDDGKDVINIYGYCDKNKIDIILDIPTAIKFAKTLRTKINNIKEDQDV